MKFTNSFAITVALAFVLCTVSAAPVTEVKPEGDTGWTKITPVLANSVPGREVKPEGDTGWTKITPVLANSVPGREDMPVGGCQPHC
ncbi:hypothetical protein BGZ83_010101 [Gryganskiella cystojenkinii]|nr:hypothetical protein BGZ83_010101 [Gryganskiella cystojenkinii]